jgi:putative drug exporter of the RND superfamily
MKFIQTLTDKVATKKGAWITIAIWLLIMIVISAGPKLSDYKTTNFQALPNNAESIIAQNKLDEFFS